LDEPQVIALESFNIRLIAVAISKNRKHRAPFLAVTVNKKDWIAYFDGKVDLLYLFTFPKQRVLYTFDLMGGIDNKFMMNRLEGDAPIEWLPSPRFFATSHTEEFEQVEDVVGNETLYIDGAWGLQDFGKFHNCYSDVYYFTSSAEKFADENSPADERREIMEAFQDRPFKGGFSYVNLFDALADSASRVERLNIQEVQYHSPGHVTITGNDATFESAQRLISNYLDNRQEIDKLYAQFHGNLSKNKYLQMSAEDFEKGDAAGAAILRTAMALAHLMKLENIEAIKKLVDDNPLAFAKVILSIERRLYQTAKFFAQGRMNFS
jgi:hypothetical protein